MTRIGRHNVASTKDKKDLKIESLEKENEALKYFIVKLELDNKGLKDDIGNMSFELDQVSEELDDAVTKLDSIND